VKKILVTGSTGMLGSAIVRQLNEHDCSILSPSRDELDLLDGAQVRDFLESHKPDIFFHCAAKVGGIQSNVLEGSRYLTINSVIDHNVLYAASEMNIDRLFYFGSSCMYPADRDNALTEEDLLTGRIEITNESYALAKILGVKTVSALSQQKSLKWTSFIASNLYGPGDNFNPESSHLLASIIHKVELAKDLQLPEIEIWGSGTSRREFTFVVDLANWVVNVGLSEVQLPHMINVGVGYDFSVKEWYELVLGVAQSTLPLKHVGGKPEGNRRKLMNSDLAKAYGWNPTTLPQDGISKTISWYKEMRENVG
jgi:GDP-L-fucose synthase